NCLIGGKRTEARVEVIVARVDELDGNHAAADHAADLLVAGGIAPHAVAGVKRVAVEESVAGAFEAEVGRHIDDLKTIFSEPAAVVRFLALSLTMTEVRKKRLRFVNHCRVCSEHEVRKAGNGFEQRDAGAGVDNVLM